MREARKAFFYVPRQQAFSVSEILHIRTPLSIRTMSILLTREVQALDGNLALNELITLQDQVDRSTSPQNVAVTMLGVLGSLALVLAGIGLYGVVSYTVAQNTREIGLRMTLGARASDLLRLVLSEGLLLAAGGLVVGMATALSLTRFLGTYLYMSPRDPLTFFIAANRHGPGSFYGVVRSGLARSAHRSDEGDSRRITRIRFLDSRSNRQIGKVQTFLNGRLARASFVMKSFYRSRMSEIGAKHS